MIISHQEVKMRSFNKAWTYLVLGLVLLAFTACTPQAGPGQQNASTQTPVVETPTVETPTLAVPTTESPSVTETSSSDPLSGTHWQLVSFGQPGAETPVSAGTPVTLEFQENGQAGGSGGCNSFSVQYQVQAGELTFGPIASTKMACTGAGIMEQEQAYFQALQSAGKFELTGDQLKIEYNGGQGMLSFAPEQAEVPSETPGASDDLAGTSWQLESFGASGEETPVIQGSMLTLEFQAGGQAGGNSGCNSFGGEYHVEDGNLTFGQLMSTLMACADQAVMDQEGRYLGALQAASEYTLDGDRLVISGGSGQDVLNFVRSGGSQAPGETA
jgi:heat shock protein HslJ